MVSKGIAVETESLMMMEAVYAVFVGLKKFPGPRVATMFRLSWVELKKSILAFFDHGRRWPHGLHSEIPACKEWAEKTAKGLVKLAT